jgi:hypothetical protein
MPRRAQTEEAAMRSTNFSSTESWSKIVIVAVVELMS